MTAKAQVGSQVALGGAGLSLLERREGYERTVCFMVGPGEFVDVHVTRAHMEQLAERLNHCLSEPPPERE